MLREEAKRRQAHGLTAPGRTLPVKSTEALAGKGDTQDSGRVRKTQLAAVKSTVESSGAPQSVFPVWYTVVFRRKPFPIFPSKFLNSGVKDEQISARQNHLFLAGLC